MDNNFIKPMYKPPKVTVVQFQIESGFAGSGPVSALFSLDPGLDNTTDYSTASNSGSSFWGGGSGVGGGTSTSDYGSFGWSWNN